MNKEEFLKTLRKRLEVLEDKEIDDIISEYEGYIDEKVNAGATEEEAVKELGDLNEIVSDLLAAYKVKSKPSESGFNKIINSISNAIDNFMDSLNDKSAKDIIKILIEIVIILFLIWLLKIPFAIIRDLGSSIFNELVYPVGDVFSGLWRFVIEFSYVIVAIIFFIKMFQKRYFQNVSVKIIDEIDEDIKEENTKAEKKSKKNKTTNEEPKEKEVIVKKVKERTFADTLTDICIAILKFLVILFLIGIIFYLIGMTVAIGFMIYLLIKGVTYWGILILLLALFMGGAFFLELGLNFIFNKQIKAVPTFGKLISAIVLLGIGLTISAVEISNTEIIYDNYYKNNKTITKEITKTEGLKLYNYDLIVVDDSLGDKIRIEYNYPDFNSNLDLEIELENCGRGYCLYSNVNEFRWNKKFLDTVINNLKDKKIYTNDFEVERIVYASAENAEKLKSSSNYYHHSENNHPYNFTRTYYVTNVKEGNNDYYNYLTLYSETDLDDIEVVKVSKSLLPNITAGKSYEFTFEANHNIDDDIEDIFENCKLISIKETDKTGSNQIQEPIRSY